MCCSGIPFGEGVGSGYGSALFFCADSCTSQQPPARVSPVFVTAMVAATIFGRQAATPILRKDTTMTNGKGHASDAKSSNQQKEPPKETRKETTAEAETK